MTFFKRVDLLILLCIFLACLLDSGFCRGGGGGGGGGGSSGSSGGSRSGGSSGGSRSGGSSGSSGGSRSGGSSGSSGSSGSKSAGSSIKSSGGSPIKSSGGSPIKSSGGSPINNKDDAKQIKTDYTKQELKDLYNKKGIEVRRVERPLDVWGGSVLAKVGIKHSGLEVKVADAPNHLVHKGPNFGTKEGGNTVITDAQHMSNKWKATSGWQKYDGSVADLIKAGGKDYNVLLDNCNDATKRMTDLTREQQNGRVRKNLPTK